ncbi:MAG: antibiotic biosynthesis monooxygenase [Deltaproteobacteria bacterium]|nr:antibiotic biosynthesis monooxygenase [Deltaproteobacteria bacterium]
MVIVIIKMKARPEKCLEFRQTLQALMQSTRKEKGCLSHDVYQDIEYDNSFSLFQTWASRSDLDDHLRTDQFTVLMGTRSLLRRPLEITIHEISHSAGWEAVEAARR